MCLGIPLMIESIDGIAAIASDGARTEMVDLSLVGDVQPGTWVLTFLGTAREVISAKEARAIRDALAGLERVMAGGQLGDAFSDLENRTPELPPHLAAALGAGRHEA